MTIRITVTESLNWIWFFTHSVTALNQSQLNTTNKATNKVNYHHQLISFIHTCLPCPWVTLWLCWVLSSISFLPITNEYISVWVSVCPAIHVRYHALTAALENQIKTDNCFWRLANEEKDYKLWTEKLLDERFRSQGQSKLKADWIYAPLSSGYITMQLELPSHVLPMIEN